MSRLTHALIALLLIAAPISADTSKALDLVPQDALAFILVKDLRQLSDTPPLAFALRTLPAGMEAQFVVPFNLLQAKFDSINAEKKEKDTR